MKSGSSPSGRTKKPGDRQISPGLSLSLDEKRGSRQALRVSRPRNIAKMLSVAGYSHFSMITDLAAVSPTSAGSSLAVEDAFS